MAVDTSYSKPIGREHFEEGILGQLECAPEGSANAERGPQALAETELHEVGPGRYEALLPEAWTALQGVHGGFVASLAVRAVNRTMADPSRTLRAATFGFVRGMRPGAATITVQ